MSGDSKKQHGVSHDPPAEEPPTPSSRPEEKPVVDEKLFKAYELYLTERTRLSSAKQEQSKAYDQTILTYSAGAVALSITFLEKVVKNPNAKGWLYTSWILFAAAMMSTLYSLLTSQKAFEKEIALMDARYQKLVGLPEEDTSSPTVNWSAWGVSLTWLKTFTAIFTPAVNSFTTAVKWFNRSAGVLFFVGVLCFGWFALQNWIFLGVRTTNDMKQPPSNDKPVPPQPDTQSPLGLRPDAGVLPPINRPQNAPTPPPTPKGNK